MRLYLCLLISIFMYSCKKETNSPTYNYPSLSVDSLQVIQTNIPSDEYTDITFVDEAMGFAISANGRIVKTSDGGFNWESVPSPANFFLKKIQFVNRQTGYIIGGDSSGSYLLKTINGGSTWSIVNLNARIKKSPDGMYFSNPDKGFITGEALFIKTENGGRTFSEVFNNASGNYNDINFKNANEGYVTSSAGLYYKTSNSGNTWQIVQTRSVNTLKEIYFAGADAYIRDGEGLLAINNGRQITVPNGAYRFLFLDTDKCVAVGQHYETGFWPYGDIYLTNSNWANSERKHIRHPRQLILKQLLK